MTEVQKEKLKAISNRLDNIWGCEKLDIFVKLNEDTYAVNFFHTTNTIHVCKDYDIINHLAINLFSDEVIDKIICAVEKEVEEKESEMDNFNDSQYCGTL